MITCHVVFLGEQCISGQKAGCLVDVGGFGFCVVEVLFLVGCIVELKGGGKWVLIGVCVGMETRCNEWLFE